MKATKSLKGSINFKKTLKQGEYVSAKNLSIFTKKNGKDINYIGICVSKKHGNSVIRNRLKRWVKESYKSMEDNIQKGYSIVFLFKKNILVQNISYLLVKDEITSLFKKNGLFIDEK